MCVLSHSVMSGSLWPQAPLSMGILQARILEYVAMPSFKVSSQPRNETQVSHIAGRFFTKTLGKPSTHSNLFNKKLSDFPGGPVDRNLPANAGDPGSIPGPGRFHMPWATKPLSPNY